MKRAVALTLLAVAYPLLGCRQVLDVDDFGTKPKYLGKTDNYTYVSRVCRDCVDENCQEPTRDCLADPRCDAQARCLALCGATDHDCRGGCSVSTPSTATIATLVTCQAEHCGGSLPEADRCGGSLALHGNARCDQCLAGNSSCLQALETLSGDAAALAHDRCREACTCGGECPAGGPGCPCKDDEQAPSPVSDLAACCASQCNGTEPDWSCLGRVVSPMTSSPAPLELHLRATIPTDENEGVPNLQVRACSELTNDCTLSAPAMTNEDGWAELSIPRPARRDADRYFGYLRLTSGESAYRAPALFYFFPPIRETPVWISRRMVARDLADAVVSQVPGVIPDWDKNGGIVFSARSCNDASGEGLQIISKSGLYVYYLSSSGGQVEPNATRTTSSGFGFIPDVRPGPHRLEARLPSGELVGEYAVTVVKGSLTHIVLGPTPLGDTP